MSLQLSLRLEAPRAPLMFYLGAHHADWLGRADVPLFVSRRTLYRRANLPRASAPWALDSGGFTELSMRGAWELPARSYVDEVRRYRDEIGSLEWAAPQDWMCEPAMLKRTGLSVEEHQRRTIANFLELRELAPDLPFVPVLQGWSIGDYWRHLEAYGRAGIELRSLPLVGVGTVCRRQNTVSAALILSSLAMEGLRLHGFGVKAQGLRLALEHLASADSMAWSLSGRKNPPEGDCIGKHKSCANCIDYAKAWRAHLLTSLERN
jgi:hypothetical protein